MRTAFLCALLCALATFARAAPIALTDDLGRAIVLAQPAQRIVTLAPFLTELAFAAGAGDRVVGVSAFSDFPPQAARLPVVSSAAGVSLEQLAALRPDLVLAWRDSFRPEDIERVTRLGAAVFVAHGRRLDDVPRLLDVIGTAARVDASGAIAEFASKVAALRRAYAGKRKVDVFLEIWHRPLTTISGSHFMNDALEICGGRNVFKERAGVAPQVSWEELYRRDPFAIVGAGSAPSEAEFRDNWKARRALTAVKAARVLWVDADTIQRPTARTPEGIKRLCEVLETVR